MQGQMSVFKTILSDLFFYKSAFQARSFLSILFFNKSFHLLFLYRMLSSIWITPVLRPLRIVIRFFAEIYTGCEIHPEANLGSCLFFPHPIGIVIGRGTCVKDNVTIYQNVTLGNRGADSSVSQYPVIEDNVVIYAASSVLGNVRIGSNSVIGAHSLVLTSFNENSIIAGSPARLLRLNENSISL
jgi:serine O-acetyltransferase